MIQEGNVEWSPKTLLHCFWKCFEYLIHCVHREELSNFFIPQNNMFSNKVVGAARTALLEKLYHYNNMYVSCLLLSPTLRSILEPALSSPTVVVSPAEGHDKAFVDLDGTLLGEMCTLLFKEQRLSDCFMYLSTVDKLSRSSLSPYKALSLQYCSAVILVQTAFTLLESSSYNTCKNVYKTERTVCNMLKRASRVGLLSHSLYLALYYCRTGRYNEALRVTYLIKQRLSQPYVMYHGDVDKQRYNEAVRGMSLSKRMKTVWVDDVELQNKVHYIDELMLEQNARAEIGEQFLSISPFVLTDMLLVLSHFRFGNRSQHLQSMTDLQTLLLYHDGRYVPSYTRDLSWQILGICQQVVGDLNGALQTYHGLLRRNSFTEIQKATEKRISTVERQLHRNMQLSPNNLSENVEN
jgi:hypothetical protein